MKNWVVRVFCLFFTFPVLASHLYAQTTDQGALGINRSLELDSQDPYGDLKQKGLFWEQPWFGFLPWNDYKNKSIPENVIVHLNTPNYERAEYMLRQVLYDRFGRPNRDAWLWYPRVLLSTKDYNGAILASFNALNHNEENTEVILAVIILSYILERENTLVAAKYLEKLQNVCARCTITKNLKVLISDLESMQTKRQETP